VDDVTQSIADTVARIPDAAAAASETFADEIDRMNRHPQTAPSAPSTTRWTVCREVTARVNVPPAPAKGLSAFEFPSWWRNGAEIRSKVVKR
jgi:hypothetical protein